MKRSSNSANLILIYDPDLYFHGPSTYYDLDLDQTTSFHTSDWSKTLIFEVSTFENPDLDTKILKLCEFVPEISP